MQSISAYESNTPRWSHKFHPHLCTNWCLQIFVLSTYTSRLEHSVCLSPSHVLVVCKRVSWSGRLSHDTPAVKCDAHCWIFAEELKSWRFNRKCTEIGLRYGNRIWGITLNSMLQVYRKLPYPIPVALGIRYVPVAFSTTDTVRPGVKCGLRTCGRADRQRGKVRTKFCGPGPHFTPSYRLWQGPQSAFYTRLWQYEIHGD